MFLFIPTDMLCGRPETKDQMMHSESNNPNGDDTGSRRSSKRAAYRRRGRDAMKSMATPTAVTTASLVGAGVALGFGLYATRRRWLPYAGDMASYARGQWALYANRISQGVEDLGEMARDKTSQLRNGEAADSMPSTIVEANHPGRNGL